MYELTYQDIEKLKISTRLVAKELLDRGYRVRRFASTGAILQVDMPDHPVPMRLFSVLDESTSYIAARAIAGNKQVTNAILRDIDVSVPEEMYVLANQLDNARDAISAFIARHGRVVMKSIDGAHGSAVFTNLTSYDDIVGHIDAALADSGFSGVVIQQQLSGIDIRVLCIGGSYISAITRVPATVVGDGVRTVEELIAIENQRDDRGGDNYNTLYNKINLDYVRQYLSQEDMRIVLAAGERKQVIGIANVGVGGTRKNIEHDIPRFMIDQAEQIARELRLPVCGVDFFVDVEPRSDMTPKDIRATVIEVNFCPGLVMYESLDDSRQVALVRRLVDQQVAAHYALYPVATQS